jgi:hypothetical protein
VVEVEGVHVPDGVLLVGGGATGPGGSDELSAVLITAKISTTTRTTAAAPAAKMVPGRLIQWSGSWSAGTPEC